MWGLKVYLEVMFSPQSDCLLLGLFVCIQDYTKTTGQISTELWKDAVWVREECTMDLDEEKSGPLKELISMSVKFVAPM